MKEWNVRITLGAWQGVVMVKAETALEAHQMILTAAFERAERHNAAIR